MKKNAVIVAGGSGTRMGGGIPKQFRSLCGHPVLWWSMKAFHDEDPGVNLILVLPEEFVSLWKDFFSKLPQEESFPHIIVTGGKSRSESVRNGLSAIEDDDSLVAVHDGARPLVSKETIASGWAVALENGAAIPVIPVTDSLRIISDDVLSKSVNREDYRVVQTPQVFKTSLLKEAYKKAGSGSFSDDATVVENMGHNISLFPGQPDNIKITNPKDLAVATVLMGNDA